MSNKQKTDFSTGSIPKHMISFALPIMIGLLVGMGYSIINTIWIGNLLGKEAMGAVAVSFPITFIMIAIATGSTTATSILISQAMGAKDEAKVKKVVNTSWWLFSLLGVVMLAVIFLIRKDLIDLIGTPEAIKGMAETYLTISLASFLLSYIYYILNAIFVGIGNSKIPAVFLVLSTVVNAVLDPVLIHWIGLEGAPLASCIGGVVAIVAALIYIKKVKQPIKILPTGFELDKEVALELLKVGMPAVVQQCLMPISLMFITSFINGFGSDAIAAYGAASKIDYLAIIPGMAISNAVAMLTGQNLGAGEKERVKEIFKWGIIISMPILVTVAILIMIFPTNVLTIFARDSKILELGATYLRINAIGYCLFSLSYITNGIINGSGKTYITMAISLFSLIICRIPLTYFLSRTGLGLNGIWYGLLITYGVTVICGLAYYGTGRYAYSKVETLVIN